jgi:hypothetical protein
VSPKQAAATDEVADFDIVNIRACARCSRWERASRDGRNLLFSKYAGAGRAGTAYDEGNLSLVNCTLAENDAKGGDRIEIGFPGLGYGGAMFSQSTPSFLNVTAEGTPETV